MCTVSANCFAMYQYPILTCMIFFLAVILLYILYKSYDIQRYYDIVRKSFQVYHKSVYRFFRLSYRFFCCHRVGHSSFCSCVCHQYLSVITRRAKNYIKINMYIIFELVLYETMVILYNLTMMLLRQIANLFYCFY